MTLTKWVQLPEAIGLMRTSGEVASGYGSVHPLWEWRALSNGLLLPWEIGDAICVE